MTVIVTTRRALCAMQHKRRRRGPEEGWIQEAFRCLDSERDIPTALEKKLKSFAINCLRWH